MLRLMSIFSSIILASVIFASTPPVAAQDIVLNLADILFHNGNYYEAITEYKRYVFFNSDTSESDISYAYFKMGIAYRNEKLWDLALDTLQKSIQTAKTEKDRDERKISLAVTQISQKKYSAAKFTLIKLEMYSPDEEVRRRAYFFHGICALYQFNWQEAKSAFEGYYKNHPDKKSVLEEEAKIYSNLDQALKAKYKSPKFAKCLSSFIPGAGQIYSGDWRNGINAVALNLATGSLVFSDLFGRQNKGTDLILLSFFIRFYRGNRYLAEKAALDRNQSISESYAENILKILMDK